MADPQRIDAGYGSDGFDVAQALVRFDLGDHHRALVQRRHLGSDVTAGIVVVRETECCAAFAERRIARAGDDVRGLGGGCNHRDHHAECADVQRSRDE